MAKINIKSEKSTPIEGIFHVRELFSHYEEPFIDKVLVKHISFESLSWQKSL